MAIISAQQAAKLKRIVDIDWNCWQPCEQATLLFVLQQEKVLLIRKKRGLGKGKINAAGGRLEPGETPIDCAVREVQEELCITVLDPKYVGEIDFQFTDGYSFHLSVFLGTSFVGVPTETEEAIPMWFPVSDLPFDEMWADDIYWVDKALRAEKFYGRFLFEQDRLLDFWMKP